MRSSGREVYAKCSGVSECIAKSLCPPPAILQTPNQVGAVITDQTSRQDGIEKDTELCMDQDGLIIYESSPTVVKAKALLGFQICS